MLPVLFKIGPFPIHSWGVLLMLGFLLASWRASKVAPRYGLTAEDAWDVALWGLLGGVIGARLAYVGLNTAYFLAHPGEIAALWTGGMTFYGGLGGGILAGVIVCRLKKINVADMADIAAVSFPIGYALGRIGCFLNGCCYGSVCAPPLGMRFHLQDGTTTDYSHPAQLYGAAAGVLLYLLLLPLERRRAFRGQVMLAFLFGYSVYRFLIEFVRAGATADFTTIARLTQGQIASLLLALAAATLFVIASRRAAAKKPPTSSGDGSGSSSNGKKGQKVSPSPAA